MLTRRLMNHEWGGWALLCILGVLVIAVPVLNLAVPQDNPFHVPTYTVTLMGKYLCFAMLAISLDLVWGYCGILSLGHGAFFALGGYAMGMYLMRQIGTRGVYGNPELPDFMVFLNWDQLPWFWYGLDHFWFAMLLVVLVPGLGLASEDANRVASVGRQRSEDGRGVAAANDHHVELGGHARRRDELWCV